MQSSTLQFDETDEPFHIQQGAQIRAFRAAWKDAGHARSPRVSVSRSIFALINDRDCTDSNDLEKTRRSRRRAHYC
jgi:hypothetical protein